ncbi:hypothetical protein DIS16_00855 [Levilactobacillus brevis]|nr:hypothetical protein DIS16_00855 [Levilactobacillus brevis]
MRQLISMTSLYMAISLLLSLAIYVPVASITQRFFIKGELQLKSIKNLIMILGSLFVALLIVITSIRITIF